MKKLFLLNFLLALGVSFPSFSVTPKSPSDFKKPGDTAVDGEGKPGSTPGRSGLDVPGGSHGGPSGPRISPPAGSPAGSRKGTSRTTDETPPGESKEQKAKAADQNTYAQGGLKALAESPSIKAKLDALIQGLAEKFQLSEEGKKSLNEAFALLYRQEELYKDGTDYVEKAKSFIEEFFGNKDVIKALTDQKIDPAQFAGDLILAFKNVPDQLKTELTDIAELLKGQDKDLAVSRMIARAGQISVYSKAFKEALDSGKNFENAERAARLAVNQFYTSKGLTEEEANQLRCECLKTQFACAK